MQLSILLSLLAIALSPLVSAATIISVGPSGDFTTLKAAVASLAKVSGDVEIQLAPGIYNEAVQIKYGGSLTLSAPNGQANIESSSFKDFGDPSTHNREASTLIVTATELKIKDIRIINKPKGRGPAQAIFIEKGSSVMMNGGSLESYQDTVYVQGGARFLVSGVTIVGAVDFLYGEGTLYIQGSEINSVGKGSIAAWRGGSGFGGSKPGCYISNSRVVGKSAGSVYLGRPWDTNAVTVYIDTHMDSSVNPAGWSVWQNSDPRVSSATKFIEIGSSGPGFVASARKIGKVLPDSQAGAYSQAAIWGRGAPSS